MKNVITIIIGVAAFIGAIYYFVDYLDRDIVYISYNTKKCVFVDSKGIKSKELCKEYETKSKKYVMAYVQ